MKQHNILLFITGIKLAGAEKRALRYMNSAPTQEFRNVLLLNRTLHEQAVVHPEFAPIIQKLRSEKRIAVVPNPPLSQLNPMNLWYTLMLFLYLMRHPLRYRLVHSMLNHYPNILCAFIFRHMTICEICGPQDIPQLFGDPDEFTPADKQPNFSERQRKLRRFFIRQATHIRCVSKSIYDRTCKHLDMHGMAAVKERLSYAPIPLFIPGKDIDAEFGKAQKENLIVYASTFLHRKNPILFARVIKRFLANHPDWKAVMLGGRTLTDEVREILSAEEASGQVAKIGRVPDIYSYIARSRIYVSLITPDNYPSQSIFESMYCRNALLCSNVGETYRMVGPENGILTSFEDDQVLADLERMVADPDALERMGEASRQRLLQEFPVSKYVDDLFAIYRELL